MRNTAVQRPVHQSCEERLASRLPSPYLSGEAHTTGKSRPPPGSQAVKTRQDKWRGVLVGALCVCRYTITEWLVNASNGSRAMYGFLG